MKAQITSALPRAGSRRRYSPERREAFWGYLFISPWLAGLLLLTAGPILATFYYSLTDYPVMKGATWIGLGNFRKMFSDDPLVAKSLYNTAYYVLLSVPLHQIVSFGLALLLARDVRGTGFFRTAYYLPVMTPFVAMAVMWKTVFNPAVGLLNQLLFVLNLQPVNPLASEIWVKPVMVILTLWLVGTPMIIYLASRQGVPEQLYEAASMDGASPFTRLWRITIPMMTPAILYNLILDIINSFQVFAHALIITDGGPVNSSLFYVLYLYRHAFQFFDMGYASALAVVLFAVVLALTVMVMRSSAFWVHYERT